MFQKVVTLNPDDGPEQKSFEGYAAQRTAILKFIADQNIDNVVFVTADIHGTLVNNLTYQLGPFQPQLASGAFEVVTGAVAFEEPFGPTVAAIAAELGFISPLQRRTTTASRRIRVSGRTTSSSSSSTARLSRSATIPSA